MKKLFIASVGLCSFFASTLVYAQDPWRDYGMRPWMMNWGFGLWWFMPLVVIAFWIVVIVGILSLTRWLARSKRGGEIKSEETALDILRKRYAKGEISKEDFERMKKDIL